MTKLRILAMADFHGRFDLLTLPLPEHDVICVAGDMMSKNDISVYEKWLSGLSAHAPVLVIPGNHDFPAEKWVPSNKRIKNLLFGAVTIQGIKFAGFNWTYCKNMPEFEQIYLHCCANYMMMKRMASRIHPCDVLVSHSPPFGVLDSVNGAHIGVPGLLEWATNYNCPQIICGHVHESGGWTKQHGRVKITNVAERAMLVEIVLPVPSIA